MYVSFDIDVYVSKTSQSPSFSAGKKAPRAMPGGILGAVHRGLVYPVYALPDGSGRRIYLDDEPIVKDDCPYQNSEQGLSPFVVQGQSPQTGSDWVYPTDWYIETNSYGHYVVLNARSDGTVRSLAARLQDEGFDVLRWDASSRPADNGKTYEWFIRVGLGCKIYVLKQIVQGLLKQGVAGPFTVEIREKVAQLIERLGPATLIENNDFGVDKLSRARRLVAEACADPEPDDEATALIDAITDLRDMVEFLGYGSTETVDILNPEFLSAAAEAIDGQYRTIERLESQLRSSQEREIVLAAEKARLTSEVSSARADLSRYLTGAEAGKQTEEALFEELAKIESERDSVLAERNILEQRLKDLTCSTPSAVSQRQRVRNQITSRIGETLDVCFPTLAFDPDAPYVLSERFFSMSSVLRILTSLQSSEESLPRLRLRGKAGNSGWNEVTEHIHTGRDDRGRIYVRDATLDSCVWEVVIHWKRDEKEQDRIIERLSQLGPFTERVPFRR